MEEFTELLKIFTKIEQEIKDGITNGEQNKEGEILNAYNGIILYAYPVWQSQDKKLKEKIKITLADIYDRLRNSLDILESDIELPVCLTTEVKVKEKLQKIKQEHTDSNMMEGLKDFREKFDNLEAMLQASEERNRNFEERIENLTPSPMAKEEYPDIVPNITSGDEIQLQSYHSIPEFSGKLSEYRPWRNQVLRRMNMIVKFQTNQKYEAGLGIVRAKITGTASDVITNNKTAYNIYAIIGRLDSAFTDQRPLYIVEAELTMIKQMGKSLQEYYEEINQALNVVISKITLSYKGIVEQTTLVTEAQKRAVRTFIKGLRSQSARNILYGQNPQTLEEAYTTARTVYYENEYLYLEQPRNMEKCKQTTNHQIGMQQQQHKYTTRLNSNNEPQTSYLISPQDFQQIYECGQLKPW